MAPPGLWRTDDARLPRIRPPQPCGGPRPGRRADQVVDREFVDGQGRSVVVGDQGALDRGADGQLCQIAVLRTSRRWTTRAPQAGWDTSSVMFQAELGTASDHLDDASGHFLHWPWWTLGESGR